MAESYLEQLTELRRQASACYVCGEMPVNDDESWPNGCCSKGCARANVLAEAVKSLSRMMGDLVDELEIRRQ